jgi:DNA-binding transcriptional LysR family regulator
MVRVWFGHFVYHRALPCHRTFVTALLMTHTPRDRLQRLRDADLNSLLVLSVLLHTQGVSKAAARLSISQPAVSRSLDRLRRVFNDALLVRSGNSMVLTPKGRELIPLLDALLDDADRILVQGGDTADPATFVREVTIACSEYVQITIAEVLPAIHKLAPQLTMHFRPMMVGDDAYQALTAGHVDMMIGMVADLLAALHIRRLYLEPFVCLMRVDDPAAAPEGLSFEEFCARPHLDISPSGRRILGARIDSAARKHGGTRNVAWTISSFMAAPQIVADTNMISIVPAKIAHRLPRPANVVVAELLFPSPLIEVVMYWHNVTHSDPVCMWLREQFAQLLATKGLPPTALTD